MCRVCTDSMFLNKRFIIYFWEWELGAGVGVKKLVIFCGRHNLMIPNVKKVMFLALVPVLQWNKHPYFSVYVRSKWKVTWRLKFLIFKNGTKMRNCESLFKQILLWEKN